jgi:hypothetical protein
MTDTIKIKNKVYVICNYTEKEKEYFKQIGLNQNSNTYLIELKVYKQLEVLK